ncbi:MAG: DUF2156 domain-containing protein [Deltaproteobacteria bacterium]|nr:DUF2156 domain-containing protein [Deltaproteobacteria bacterium]
MNFIPLTADAYPRLKPFFDGQPYALSVYSLSSLIIWSTPLLPASYSIDDDRVMIRGDSTQHPEQGHWLLPVSRERLPSPEELHDLAQEQGNGVFRFVPGHVVEGMDQEELGRWFDWEEEPGFSDYVYRAEDLRSLRGNRYAKKRNLIKQFAKSYLDAGRVRVTSMTPEETPECLDFLEQWCAERDCDEETQEGLFCEKQAVIQALNHMERLEMPGIVIRVDGTVSAFAMASRLNAHTGVLNIEKAFPGIKGLYQFLDNECAKRLLADCEWINKESDVNLPELARSKQSYHPALRVKSYRLNLRS